MDSDSFQRLSLSNQDLVQGLATPEVEARLQRGLRLHDTGNRILAFYLTDMDDRGLHQALGFARTLDYAMHRLGLDRRRARELITAGRKLLVLPAIDAAFCAQRIGWAKVKLLVKVTTPEHEAAWLERALSASVRDLKREVGRAKEGDAPRKPGDRRGLSETRFTVHASIPALTFQKWEQAMRKASDEVGRPVNEAELLDILSDMLLTTSADGTIPGRTRLNDSLYRVYAKKDGDDLLVHTEHGEIPVDHPEHILCDCEADRDEKTPDWMREAVRARDLYRCGCCGSPYGLHVHHIVFRSKGGRTRIHNLITLCHKCHRLVHDELLVLEGPHAEAITFHDDQGRCLHESGRTVDPAVLARLKPPKRAADSEEPAVPSPARVGLADVPDTIDADWWRRHAGLIRTRGTARLVFQPGRPLPESEASACVEPAREPVAFADAFADVVGQDERLRRFDRALAGRKAQGESFPHTLLTGPAGTGKTTLAKAIAEAAGSRLVRIPGSLLQDVHTLIGSLASLGEHDVVFVDEIHAAARTVLEALYEAMEEGQISLTFQDGVRSRSVCFRLPSFTLLGATTKEGSLPEPLRNRFGLREYLDFYPSEDLALLVTAKAASKKLEILPDAARRLAAFSRGTPREAVRLLGCVVDEVSCRGETRVDRATIDRATVDRVLEDLGYDRDGLDRGQQRYMHLLGRSTVPIPLARLAHLLGQSVDTVTRYVEPFLFRLGLVQTTPGGRVAVGRPRLSEEAWRAPNAPFGGAGLVRDRAVG